MKELSNESIDLIVSDPPYYKVINEKWDKQWKTEEEYLNWCQLWFNECVRILKPTGSFYCYGNFDILSKQKVLIFDKQLYFRQNITLDKGLKAIAGRTSDKLRMFPTASEYLLFYVKQGEDFCIENQRKYLYDEWKKSKLSIADIKRLCGFTGNMPYHWFAVALNSGKKSQWQLPTKENYLKLQSTGFWQKPYDELLNEFKNKRFTFNLPIGVTDVWGFTPDKIRYGHKTQKPTDITDRIILASSKKNDLVYIPFAGSGTEIERCIAHNRNYIGTEINKEYIDNIIIPRVNTIK